MSISLYQENWQYDASVYAKINRPSLGITKDTENEEIRKRIMDNCPEVSQISFNGERVTVGVDVSIDDNILTLSTCHVDNKYRVVLHAVKK